jgi:hypothetical protein
MPHAPPLPQITALHLSPRSRFQILVKKFAVLILHAKDPVEEDRGRLNRPAKNLIAKLDAVPNMTNPEIDAFRDTHMNNPFLLRILELGQYGFEII